MKTSQIMHHLPAVAVLFIISLLLLVTFSVSAAASDLDAGVSLEGEIASQTKVDAGNALNARATEPIDSDRDGYTDTYSEMPPRDIDKPFLIPSEDDDIPSIREGGRTVEAGNIPEKQQQQAGDDDRDGYGDVAATNPDRLDDDSDDDGLTEVTGREIINSQQHQSIEISETSTRLLEALSLDTATPLLYQGIKMRVTAESCGSETDDDCSGAVENLPSASFGIKVSGVEVRGWNQEQKSILQNRASAMTAVENPNDFGIWLTNKVLNDESITEADVDTDEVMIKYDTKTRLLGFIPITIPVTATLKGHLQTSTETLTELLEIPALDGSSKTAVVASESVTGPEVELDYPWYGFLVNKKTTSELIISNMRDIVINYNASQKKEAKFKAGKALADTVK